jgi:hypothetical protein
MVTSRVEQLVSFDAQIEVGALTAGTDSLQSSMASAALSNGGSVNNGFVEVRSIAPVSVVAELSFQIQLPPDTFTHSNVGEVLSLSAMTAQGTALPSWLIFDADTGIFSGIAPQGVRSIVVMVTATDSQQNRASTQLELRFEDRELLSQARVTED